MFLAVWQPNQELKQNYLVCLVKMFYSIWKQTLHLQTFGKKKKWKSSFKILLENSGSFLLEALSLGLLARLLESQVPSVWVDFNSSKDALAVRPLHSLCQGCSAPLVNFLFGINNKAMRYEQSSLKFFPTEKAGGEEWLKEMFSVLNYVLRTVTSGSGEKSWALLRQLRWFSAQQEAGIKSPQLSERNEFW